MAGDGNLDLPTASIAKRKRAESVFVGDEFESQGGVGLVPLLYGFFLAAVMAGSQVLFRSAANINQVLLPLLITNACGPAQASLIFLILLMESFEHFMEEALYDKLWQFSSDVLTLPREESKEAANIHIPHRRCAMYTGTFLVMNLLELVSITFVDVTDKVTQVIIWWLIAESVAGVGVYFTLACTHLCSAQAHYGSPNSARYTSKVWFFYAFYVLHARGVDMGSFVLCANRTDLWLRYSEEEAQKWERAGRIAGWFQAAFVLLGLSTFAIALVLIVTIGKEHWDLPELFSGNNPPPSYCEECESHEVNLIIPGDPDAVFKLFP